MMIFSMKSLQACTTWITSKLFSYLCIVNENPRRYITHMYKRYERGYNHTPSIAGKKVPFCRLDWLWDIGMEQDAIGLFFLLKFVSAL